MRSLGLVVALPWCGLPVAAQDPDFTLRACGAVIGQPLDVELGGAAPASLFLFVPSASAGPLPLSLVDPRDPRALRVGLDLSPLWFVGSFGPGGRASFPIPLPANPALRGFRLHLQAALFPGTTFLIGGLSNPVVVELDQGIAWVDRGITVNAARTFTGAVAQADGTWLLSGGGTGGLNNVVGLASTEVFDPWARAWSSGPPMTTERAMHTITPLDGVPLRSGHRVLIAGGLGPAGAMAPTTTAEVYRYDAVPAARTFTAVRSMTAPRMGHTATLLPDGRVFVTGGLSASPSASLLGINSALSSTELYDPATGTWSPGPPMQRARAGHTAHLMTSGAHAGKVLLVGGLGKGLLLTAPFLRECEWYDPASNQIGPAPTMAETQGRGLHNAIVLRDGRLLVVGGVGGTVSILSPGVPLRSAELYDPVANAWSATGSVSLARGLGGIALLEDGRVLFAGGASGTVLTPVPSSLCETFDPGTGAWAPTASMTRGRSAFALIELPGCVPFAVSGSDTTGTVSATCESLYR